MARRNGAIETAEPDALRGFREALARGEDWFDALLKAIAAWDTVEEVVDGRRYQYLIGGEAFEWLLLAERLCAAVDGAIPPGERDELLFQGRLPRRMDDDALRCAFGEAKHKAHLNFVYGVAVEEALQLVVEEEVLKEQRSLVWNCRESAEPQVFERVYGRSRDELFQAFREERALPAEDAISYADLKAFTYWLFKYRVSQSDPARVASDTRKALVQLSQLEAAARRRAQHRASADAGVVVDGEVVAHVR
jgi:hypothetical protein